MSEEKKRRILEEEDYIDHPKYKNSLNKLVEKYPDGVDEDTIAKVLNMSKQEVQEIYQNAINKLKKSLQS